MNLYQNQKKLQIIVGACLFFVLAMVIGVLFSLNTGKKTPLAPNKIVPPQVAPESLPKEVKDLKAKLIGKTIKNNNGDLLIYQSQNFYIEYISSPQVFFVKILKDAEKSKLEAQNWFKEQGAKQEDLCTLPVRFFLSTIEVRKENLKFSSLPEGCTGQPVTNPDVKK